MNKEEFVAVLANKADVSNAAAVRMLDAFGQILAEEMKRSGRLQLRRLGTFSLVKRKARMGTNPKTGDPIRIKAKKTVRFTPGSTLQNSI